MKKQLKILGGLFLGAFLVRVLFLGRADLWCDEILFISQTMPSLSPWEIVKTSYERFLVLHQLPLAEVVQNLAQRMLLPLDADISHNPFLQRFPAVIWGALTVPVFFLLARKVLRPLSAWTATFMVALFLYPVFYSREAYFLAPLMLLSTSVWFIAVKAMAGDRMRWPWWVVLSLLAVLTAFTHLTGVLLLILLVIAALVGLFLHRPAKGRDYPVRSLTMLACCLAVGLVAVSPFLLKLLTHGAANRAAEGLSRWVILYDIVGKWFMGNLLVFELLGWVVFVAGLTFLLKPGPHAYTRRVLGGILVAGLLTMVQMTYKTLYSARFFIILMPPAYLAFTAGLETLAALPGRFRPAWAPWTNRVFAGLAGFILAAHALVFLPMNYALPAKGIHYGGIAAWLNENVPPGKPYLFESGYELRFVSQFHPTPQRIAACPYIHGNDPGELTKLRDRQKEFMQQFPEAPWIESARHGRKEGMDLGDWTWPHRYYRQRYDIKNNALKRMSNWGLWMQSLGSRVDLNSISTPIWFNTPEDVEAIARERGDVLLMDYTSWGTMRFGDGEYGRIVQKPEGAIRVKTLTGNQPVQGRFALNGAILGQGDELRHQLVINGRVLQRFRQKGAQLGQMNTPVVSLAPGDYDLVWRMEPGQELLARGMLMQSLRFVPGPGEPAISLVPEEAMDADAPLIKWIPPDQREPEPTTGGGA